MDLSKPTIIKLGSHVIHLSDIKGVLGDVNSRMVLLKNGMKVEITETESKNLQTALNVMSRQIVKAARGEKTL